MPSKTTDWFDSLVQPITALPSKLGGFKTAPEIVDGDDIWPVDTMPGCGGGSLQLVQPAHLQVYGAGTAPLGTGSTWDEEPHGRWSVLIREQFLGARAPAGQARLTQSPHNRSPAVGRQVGLGGRRGRVASVCAIAPGCCDVCSARARRLPSRRLLPLTRSAQPSRPL